MRRLRIGRTRKVKCPVCQGKWKSIEPKCPSCKRGRVRMVVKR